MAPLLELPGFRFFSLQKGARSDEGDRPAYQSKLINLMSGVRDFADTSALIEQLDLVIGVDTSVIHLAGAMGKPVWVLSRYDGCWRWLQDRDDSPWYPSMRLFRQTKQGDWAGVIEKIKIALQSWPSGTTT
jgi:ADP-heptose:LPS heptosyltransferase